MRLSVSIRSLFFLLPIYENDEQKGRTCASLFFGRLAPVFLPPYA